MIKSIVPGDITARTNVSDIIIGMNRGLEEVTGIGLPFTWRVKEKTPFPLGSVISFELDSRRHLHMIICHEIGNRGWHDAEKYVRLGLDYLWQKEGAERYFSIVEIGTGRIGKRDGADATAIHTAIANAWLPVDLYIFDSPTPVALEAVAPKELRAYRCWDQFAGERKIAA